MKLTKLLESLEDLKDLDDHIDDADYELPNEENSITPHEDYDTELVNRVGVGSMNPVGRTYKKGLGKTAKEPGPRMSLQGTGSV